MLQAGKNNRFCRLVVTSSWFKRFTITPRNRAIQSLGFSGMRAKTFAPQHTTRFAERIHKVSISLHQKLILCLACALGAERGESLFSIPGRAMCRNNAAAALSIRIHPAAFYSAFQGKFSSERKNARQRALFMFRC